MVSAATALRLGPGGAFGPAGFRLHQLIDPDGTPPDSFLRSLTALHEAFHPAWRPAEPDPEGRPDDRGLLPTV
jgi:hypothetical protein